MQISRFNQADKPVELDGPFWMKLFQFKRCGKRLVTKLWFFRLGQSLKLNIKVRTRNTANLRSYLSELFR